MGEEVQTQDLQLIKIMVEEDREEKLAEDCSIGAERRKHRYKNISWWIKISIHTFSVLAGQATATLLGRLYYEKGGSSKWMATIAQLAGFPVLLPFYFIHISRKQKQKPKNTEPTQSRSPSITTRGLVYISLGILNAANCYLYSIGLKYLPVSTYSLISASQLAFNSFFSFFLNKQKFTAFVVNSIVLLTISSTLLVFQNDSTKTTQVSKAKYAIGFICTVGASAGYGLVLSLTQLAFRRVIKKQSLRAIMEMIIYPASVANCLIVIGLFVSKEWARIGRESEEFELGKVSYVMVLVWTAIAWLVFTLGMIGLILESSALFSNAIGTLGLPIVPILAVIFFSDSMDGIKAIAMVLATWGFLSYMYQHYLDHRKSKIDNRAATEVSEASSSNRSE